MSKTSSQLSVTTHPHASLQRLRKFSRLLDNAIPIPGTKHRIGLDPILGLLPGAGDFVGTALSAYIVIEAARLGLPKATLGRMVFNILLEGLDLFDFAWKANIQNVALLEAHLNVPHKSEKVDRWFIFLLLGGLLIFSVGLVTLSVLVLKIFISAVTSQF
jgi:hypothetical protein